MKVCIVTGSRAEYGLLYPLMRELERVETIQMQCIVTGMHLAEEFGLTYREIERDGFHIHARVDNLSASDTYAAMARATGRGLAGFADAFEKLRPELVVLLGDRFEIFAAAASALLQRIPIAHIHGGELTEGAIDDSLRHAITKMSHLHFASAEEYRQRIIRMGEEPHRVFNVGALAVDNIVALKPMSRRELQEDLGVELGARNLLITYHPETLDQHAATVGLRNLLDALTETPQVTLIFTKANADAQGRSINQMIESFAARSSNRFVFASLGRVRYLSLLKLMDGMVGNSSSGMIEAPCLKVGTVNIGTRQKGRIRAPSIIDCEPDREQIKSAIQRLYSDVFRRLLSNVDSPYGSGNTAKAIAGEIQKRAGMLSTRKRFHDNSASAGAAL